MVYWVQSTNYLTKIIIINTLQIHRFSHLPIIRRNVSKMPSVTRSVSSDAMQVVVVVLDDKVMLNVLRCQLTY